MKSERVEERENCGLTDAKSIPQVHACSPILSGSSLAGLCGPLSSGGRSSAHSPEGQEGRDALSGRMYSVQYSVHCGGELKGRRFKAKQAVPRPEVVKVPSGVGLNFAPGFEWVYIAHRLRNLVSVLRSRSRQSSETEPVPCPRWGFPLIRPGASLS